VVTDAVAPAVTPAVPPAAGDAPREKADRAGPRSRRMVGPTVVGHARVTAAVCQAAGCLSAQSDRVFQAITDRLVADGITDVAVKRVGCLGLCAAGPLIEVPETGELFRNVEPDDVEPIVARLKAATAVESKPVREPFFERQHKVVLENCGKVDPENIDDYVARKGYRALTKAVRTMTPQQVIDELSKSGLRGRGGAGYPTGLKWATVAKQTAAQKFVVCNADEGDPGAFMDRSVLESDPFRILEGMAIAGYAVGAHEGFVYCRAEYPLAVARLKAAIHRAEKAGFLGASIAGSTFSFHVELRLGAGAFVCGEETALIASIEGGRGAPIPRPPFPAASGLHGRPTLINNVESFASVPVIVRDGGEHYALVGTGKSRGTKVFALAGRIVNGGLIEVPLGIKLRDIIFEIGGGVPDGGRFKAVQTGGPSGGCLPEELLDMSVDYESLIAAGSFMGSGGMIVMDDTSCMVEVARYFMDFCREESCGKCVPCRVGTTQLHMLLTKITEGRGDLRDLERLESISAMVRDTSLCGLGQGAPNPVFSTLRYFRHEYLSHIVDKVCPAGVCAVSTGAVAS
jgi:bidirectional [NiFe] hydrogenase diaphorase subunit